MASQRNSLHVVVGERPVLPPLDMDAALTTLRDAGMPPRSLVDTKQALAIADLTISDVRAKTREHHTSIEDLANTIAKMKGRFETMNEGLIDATHAMMILHAELQETKRKSISYRVWTYLSTDLDHTRARWRAWWDGMMERWGMYA